MLKSSFFIFLILSLSLFMSSFKNNTSSKYAFPNNNQGYLPIDKKIVLPVGFHKKYTIQKEENLSYKNINRRQIRITIPSGLKKSEVRDNIKHAVKQIYKKYKPDGISILVFEAGDNIESFYTVAKGDFAPYGIWKKIRKNIPLKDYELSIKTKESYFQPKSGIVKKGSSVKIYNDKKYDLNKRKFVKAKNISLSNSAKSWMTEDIIVKVPNYSVATIVDSYKEKLINGSELIRYKVKVNYKGKTYIGWVHGEQIIK